MASTATSRDTPPFSASATASPKAITSTISSRLTAIFIWQASPLPPMRVTFGPIASSTGFDPLEGRLVAADHDRGIALHDGDRAAGERAVEHDRSGAWRIRPRRRGSHPARSCSCRCRCRPCLRPARCRLCPSATAFTAAESVTIENTMSDSSATARGLVGEAPCPAVISGSALSRDRFQPVTCVSGGHQPRHDRARPWRRARQSRIARRRLRHFHDIAGRRISGAAHCIHGLAKAGEGCGRDQGSLS